MATSNEREQKRSVQVWVTGLLSRHVLTYALGMLKLVDS